MKLKDNEVEKKYEEEASSLLSMGISPSAPVQIDWRKSSSSCRADIAVRPSCLGYAGRRTGSDIRKHLLGDGSTGIPGRLGLRGLGHEQRSPVTTLLTAPRLDDLADSSPPVGESASNRRGGPGTPHRLGDSLRVRARAASRPFSAPVDRAPASLPKCPKPAPEGPLSAVGSRSLAPADRPSLRRVGRPRDVQTSQPPLPSPSLPPTALNVTGDGISGSVFPGQETPGDVS